MKSRAAFKAACTAPCTAPLLCTSTLCSPRHYHHKLQRTPLIHADLCSDAFSRSPAFILCKINPSFKIIEKLKNCPRKPFVMRTRERWRETLTSLLVSNKCRQHNLPNEIKPRRFPFSLLGQPSLPLRREPGGGRGHFKGFSSRREPSRAEPRLNVTSVKARPPAVTRAGWSCIAGCSAAGAN